MKAEDTTTVREKVDAVNAELTKWFRHPALAEVRSSPLYFLVETGYDRGVIESVFALPLAGGSVTRPLRPAQKALY